VIDEKLTGLYAEIERRNPCEIELLQAVREVLSSIGPVLTKHSELAKHKTIERICEPERQIIFRVPWTDDNQEIQINRGFRVEFNSALGPFKGASGSTLRSAPESSSSSASNRPSRTH
jgi:glutamate dehydrogenase (NADP+)